MNPGVPSLDPMAAITVVGLPLASGPLVIQFVDHELGHRIDRCSYLRRKGLSGAEGGGLDSEEQKPTGQPIEGSGQRYRVSGATAVRRDGPESPGRVFLRGRQPGARSRDR